MDYLIEHYPIALKVLTFLMVLLNLACSGALNTLLDPAWDHGQARGSSWVQAVVLWRLRPLIMGTAALPSLLASFGQLATCYELWAGNLPNALLLALSPLVALLLHLLSLGACWLLLGVAE